MRRLSAEAFVFVVGDQREIVASYHRVLSSITKQDISNKECRALTSFYFREFSGEASWYSPKSSGDSNLQFEFVPFGESVASNYKATFKHELLFSIKYFSKTTVTKDISKKASQQINITSCQKCFWNRMNRKYRCKSKEGSSVCTNKVFSVKGPCGH